MDEKDKKETSYVIIGDDFSELKLQISEKQEQPEDVRYQLNLSEEEMEIIIAFVEADGFLSREDLLKKTSMSDTALLNTLAELREKGIVARIEAAAAEIPADVIEYLKSMEGKNYYQLLGLEFAVDREQIRRAYFNLVNKYHPDRYWQKQNTPARQTLKEIFYQLTKAYDTLSNEKRRKEYDLTLPEISGKKPGEEEDVLAPLFGERPEEEEEQEERPGSTRQFYEKALEDFRLGDYRSADLNFKLAAALEPENRDYQEGLRKTQRILSRKSADELMHRARRMENKGKIHAALNTLQRAARLIPDDSRPLYNMARLRFINKMDPNQSLYDIERALDADPGRIDYLLLLGQIQARKGNAEQAEQTFRRVLKIDSKCGEARELLEKLDLK